MSSVALTTAFQPAPSCLSDVYLTTTGDLGYLSLGPLNSAQCFPSAWQPTSQYFSPGICPSGYAAACEFTVGTETQATCCPSFYSCQTSTNWPQYSTMACTVMVSDLPSSVAPVSITAGGSVVPIGLQAGGGINAFGLSIRWKAADFATTTSPSSTPSTSSLGPSSTTQSTSGSSTLAKSTSTTSRSKGTGTSSEEQSTSSTPSTSGSEGTGTSSAEPSPSSIPSTSGLSTGAKAGIGIGAALGALVILGILIFYAMRHRRARSARGVHELPGPETSQWFSLKSGARSAGKHDMANNELGPMELHTDVPPAELHGETYRR